MMSKNAIILQNSPSVTRSATSRDSVTSREQHCRRDLPSRRKVSRAISSPHLAPPAGRQSPGRDIPRRLRRRVHNSPCSAMPPIR
jgi:hypothetical protein